MNLKTIFIVWLICNIGSNILLANDELLIKVPQDIKPTQVAKNYKQVYDTELEYITLRQTELIRNHRPELLYTSRHSYNQAETITLQKITGIVPISAYFKLATIIKLNTYQLEADENIIKEQNKEINIRLQKETKLYSTYIETSLSDTSNINSPGLRLGFIKHNNLNFTIEAQIWTPQIDNTIAIQEDNRGFKLLTELYKNINNKLILSCGASITEIYTTDSTFSPEHHEGRNYNWHGKIGYNLWNNYSHQLKTGFLGTGNYLEKDYQYSFLQIYTSLDGARFNSAYQETRIPQEQHLLKLKVGLTANVFLTENYGVHLDATTGQDSPRQISWNKLYELQANLYVIPTDNIRLWLGFGIDSQSSNGIATGKTRYTDFGINFIF